MSRQMWALPSRSDWGTGPIGMGAVLECGPQTQYQDMTRALRAMTTEDTYSMSAWSPGGSLEPRQRHLDTWAHHTSQAEL